MASHKVTITVLPKSTSEADNKNKSDDMESQSSFAPTPASESENESISDSKHEKRSDADISKEGELKTEEATASTTAPAPSIPAFDIVKAAENLLADAKKLKATLDNKGSSAESKPNDGNNHAPVPPSPEEIPLRSRIAKLGKKIAFETGLPMEVLKSDWVIIAETAAWNIFLHWRAFDYIPLNGSISIADLARAINADENLVSRIACTLISTGKLIGSRLDGNDNKPPTHISHSRISPLLRTNTSPATAALAIVSFGNGMKGFAKWPEYFSTYDRREPHTSDKDIVIYDGGKSVVMKLARSNIEDRIYVPTPFSLGWGHPDLKPWEVKARYPEYARHFELAMAAKDKGAQGALGGDLGVGGYRGANSEDPSRKFSLAWLADLSKKQQEQQKDIAGLQPLVVDVGGGLGHFLANLLAKIPEVKPEQCILQDRPEVIDQVAKNIEGGDEKLKGVKTMAHNFFDRQPEEARGAAVYVLRRVLLDYCDEQAVEILRKLYCAIRGTDGKVVIMEGVLLDKPTPENRLVDMVMMNLGGKLRNEEGYRKLCKMAGLKVTGYWVDVEGASCVVECVEAKKVAEEGPSATYRPIWDWQD